MREGLQIEDKNIPVSQKLRLLDALGETGAKVIVIGSFGSPKWCPQMANIDKLTESFVPKPGVAYEALAFNPKGIERVRKYYPKIHVTSRSYQITWELGSTFVMRNYNMITEQQIATWPDVVRRAREAGEKEGSVQIGSPWGGILKGTSPKSGSYKPLRCKLTFGTKTALRLNRRRFLMLWDGICRTECGGRLRPSERNGRKLPT
jgi:hydroxymethylglutaryl-CoA lyase